MDKEVLIQELSQSNKKVLILDDKDINPDEIVLMSSDKKGIVSFLRTILQKERITDAFLERAITVVSFREVGLEQWEKTLYSKGTVLIGNVFAPCAEDFYALCLHYIYLYAQRDYWLKKHMLEHLRNILQCESEMEVIGWFVQYLRGNHLQVRVKKIVNVPNEIKPYIAKVHKFDMFFRQIYLKIQRKLPSKYLQFKGILRHYTGEKKFLKYMKENVLGENYSILNEKGQGSSGCIMIREERKEGTFFIKGYELKEYRGIVNEIHVQKVLQQHEDEAWYLPMSNHAEDDMWIEYPFVKWPSLAKYLKNNSLDAVQIKQLGDFLVYILDKLKELDIVHNDLRCDNIMVRLDDSGALEGFVLADFGCASVKGSDPWGHDSFWGRNFGRCVCGDNRYDESIVDDAASAVITYVQAGGRITDDCVEEMKKRICRQYFVYHDEKNYLMQNAYRNEE